jgi:hypothetical protein
VPPSRLTEGQRASIRRMYSQKGPKTYSLRAIAKLHGTSVAMVKRLVQDVPRGRINPDPWPLTDY